MTATTTPRHRQVVQEAGAAAGRISGISHLVLFVQDMNEGVRFYRDVLGLRVVRTIRFTPTPEGLREVAHHSSNSAEHSPLAVISSKVRQVFFEMGNGELFSLFEVAAVSKQPMASITAVLWPTIDAGRCSPPHEPQKLDHLSFDVPGHADVVWFREHLIANGVAVSEVTERRGANNTHRFLSSIYFYDPSGNPLEIASMNAGDAEWQSYDFSEWFIDENPVPALLETNAQVGANKIVPHWIRPPTK